MQVETNFVGSRSMSVGQLQRDLEPLPILHGCHVLNNTTQSTNNLPPTLGRNPDGLAMLEHFNKRQLLSGWSYDPQHCRDPDHTTQNKQTYDNRLNIYT